MGRQASLYKFNGCLSVCLKLKILLAFFGLEKVYNYFGGLQPSNKNRPCKRLPPSFFTFLLKEKMEKGWSTYPPPPVTRDLNKKSLILFYSDRFINFK